MLRDAQLASADLICQGTLAPAVVQRPPVSSELVMDDLLDEAGVEVQFRHPLELVAVQAAGRSVFFPALLGSNPGDADLEDGGAGVPEDIDLAFPLAIGSYWSFVWEGRTRVNCRTRLTNLY